jgi:hypothetical protein
VGALALVAVELLFNTVLGEELLFRGLLLPRMRAAFGRADWVVNGVLFGFYHLHEPWVIPNAIVTGFLCAYPTRRFRSAWMGIAIHSIEVGVLPRRPADPRAVLVPPRDPAWPAAKEVTRCASTDLTARLGRSARCRRPSSTGRWRDLPRGGGRERIEAPLDDGRTALVAAALTLVLAGCLGCGAVSPCGVAGEHRRAVHRIPAAHRHRGHPIANQVKRVLRGPIRDAGPGPLGALVAGRRRRHLLRGTAPFPVRPGRVLFVWLATWAIGYSTARAARSRSGARRAIRHQVVAEERTRMARELHDVIGHTVNLLVVQAGAARLMLDRDPAMTRDLLTGMEQTGREALAGLDQALGTLRAQSPTRTPHWTPPRCPTPAWHSCPTCGPPRRLRGRRHAEPGLRDPAAAQPGPVGRTGSSRRP